MNCEGLMSAHSFLKQNRFLGPADSMLGMLWTNDRELKASGDFGMALDAQASVFTGRTFWTYRYNIFTHIGEATSREGTDFPAPTVLPRCFDINTMNGIMDLEQFDLPGCASQDFSPCLVQSEKGQVVPPLFAPVASMWPSSITKKVSSIVPGDSGKSCSVVCKERGRSCVVSVMPLINNCLLLGKYFSCLVCKVHLLSSDIRPYRNPGFRVSGLGTGACYFSATPDRMSCDATLEGVQPLCPCM